MPRQFDGVTDEGRAEMMRKFLDGGPSSGLPGADSFNWVGAGWYDQAGHELKMQPWRWLSPEELEGAARIARNQAD